MKRKKRGEKEKGKVDGKQKGRKREQQSQRIGWNKEDIFK